MAFISLKKLKNLEIKKRYVVLVVLLAAVVRFWGESSITMLQKEVPIVHDPKLSEQEIDHYIQTKQQYLDENIQISQDVLISRDLEDYLDKETHEWFLLQGWRPNRFFYVEDRIKLILVHIQRRDEKLGEADRLDTQAEQFLAISNAAGELNSEETRNAAELKKQAQDIRYRINKEIRHAGISAAEDRAVQNNISTLQYLTEQ